MADIKFSQFIDGGAAQVGDTVVGLRPSSPLENFKFNFPGSGINDANGNYLFEYGTVGALAVNHLKLVNAFTTQAALLTADGSDANIDIAITPKGTGILTLDGLNWPASDGVAGSFITTDGSGNLSFSTGGLITSATGTPNQVLVNGTSGTPQTGDITLTLPQDIATTSSPTFDNLNLTGITSSLLFVNGLHAVTGVVSGNSSILYTDPTGTPLWSSSLTNGQLMIGSTSASPQPATLTAGTNVTITNGAGSITINATGGTVNAGTANQIAYYATTGSAVSGLATPIPTSAGGTGNTTGTSTVNADMTGTYIYSTGNTLLAHQVTGTGNTLVLQDSPHLIAPEIDNAIGLSLQIVHDITNTNGQYISQITTGTPPLVVASTTNIPNLNASSLNGATFASPGSIGSGTPSSGAFTTLSATTPIPVTSGGLGLNAAANSAILYTNSSGVPAWSASLTNGQLMVGSTGASPTPATLTAGTNVTITNGAGAITINATGGTVSSGTANQIAYYATTGSAVSGLTGGNGTLLVTNATGVPSMLANPSATGKVLQSVSGDAPSYSTATYPAVATSTGTVLRADGTNWVHSTATFADTYSASTLLYSNGANTVAGLATANSAMLYTNSSGVPALSASLTNGQLMVGSTGASPTPATLTAGTNVTITNGAGAITINSTGGTVNSGTANQIAYYATTGSAVSGLTGGNGTLLVTNATGVPSMLANPSATGKVLQSVSGDAPAYSTATYPAIATTTGTILRADGTNWVRSTATFADTYSASTLLYSNGANTVTGLPTANSAMLYTNSSGVPALSASLTNGQLMVGSTGASPTPATLTAGTNVTITNGAGAITINATGGTVSSGTANQIAYYATTGSAVSGLTGGNGTLLVTNATGVPSMLTNPSATGKVLQSVSGDAPAYSTATYPAIATTTGTVLRADGTNWVRSTATFADTYSASTLLYSNGANTVTGLPTANSAMLYTNSSGVPALSASLTNGQLMIGSTGASPTPATLTGTANQITVTNGAGSVTLATPQNIGTGSSPTFAGMTLSGLNANGIVTTNGSSVLGAVAAASTYTPTIGDGTNNFVMSSQSGSYYKIGSLYIGKATVVWTGKGSATAGSAIVVSLPATAVIEIPATIGFASGMGFTGSYMTATIPTSANFINFFGSTNAGALSTVLVSNLGTAGEIIVSFAFWTV